MTPEEWQAKMDAASSPAEVKGLLRHKPKGVGVKAGKAGVVIGDNGLVMVVPKVADNEKLSLLRRLQSGQKK